MPEPTARVPLGASPVLNTGATGGIVPPTLASARSVAGWQLAPTSQGVGRRHGITGSAPPALTESQRTAEKTDPRPLWMAPGCSWTAPRYSWMVPGCSWSPPHRPRSDPRSSWITPHRPWTDPHGPWMALRRVWTAPQRLFDGRAVGMDQDADGVQGHGRVWGDVGGLERQFHRRGRGVTRRPEPEAPARSRVECRERQRDGTVWERGSRRKPELSPERARHLIHPRERQFHHRDPEPTEGKPERSEDPAVPPCPQSWPR